MDAYTLNAKLQACLSVRIEQFPGTRWMSPVSRDILDAFIASTLNVQDFVALMVSSGFTHATSIRCLVNAFAPGA